MFMQLKDGRVVNLAHITLAEDWNAATATPPLPTDEQIEKDLESQRRLRGPRISNGMFGPSDNDIQRAKTEAAAARVVREEFIAAHAHYKGKFLVTVEGCEPQFFIMQETPQEFRDKANLLLGARPE